MGKPSTVGQPTRPIQPFVLLGLINKLQLDGRYYKLVVAPSGERLRGKGRHGVISK